MEIEEAAGQAAKFGSLCYNATMLHHACTPSQRCVRAYWASCSTIDQNHERHVRPTAANECWGTGAALPGSDEHRRCV